MPFFCGGCSFNVFFSSCLFRDKKVSFTITFPPFQTSLPKSARETSHALGSSGIAAAAAATPGLGGPGEAAAFPLGGGGGGGAASA